MKLKLLLAASAASLTVAMVAAPTVASAQQITSGVSGTVTSETGAPLAGAVVTVVDTRTGATRALTTDGNGNFRTVGLPTGGPYTVTATAAGYEGQSIEQLDLNLSAIADLTFALTGGSTENVILVSAQRVQLTELAIGPSQAFGLSVLESVPSINRDIRDVIRIDPRVSISREQGGTVDRVTCLGANDRSNTFTVDGVIQADVFGLNGTPFAARNSLPLPYDSIKETAVELAPFDVEYGQFTGCAINVVTKSGQNDFHGSAFFEYQDDNLTGDTAGGEPAVPTPFENKRWGVSLDGPVIPDVLFFHFGYEEADFTGSPTNIGPIGAGYPNQQDFITLDQFNEIADIFENVYGVPVGPLVRNNPEQNERYFGRLDWYITDAHRLELTYQHLDETKQLADSLGGGVATGRANFRIEGTKSDYYAARLFSQWNDNFSTEIRYSRSDVSDKQDPLFGEATTDNPIPNFRVGVTNPQGCDISSPDCEFGFFETGPGQFRSANQLEQQVDQAKAKAELLVGNHTFTVGGEMNRADVFNLFVPNGTGIFTFANVDDLRNGIINSGFSFNAFTYSAEDIITGASDGFQIYGTPTGDITGAGAAFDRTIWSAYIQDSWQVSDQLNVLLGVRADFFSGDDTPRENSDFVARYGYSNAFAFDDLDPVFLPRLGFTYNFDNFDGFFRDSQLRGGVGVFSGGDPGVWYSNAFSNDGFASAPGRLSDPECDAVRAAGIDLRDQATYNAIIACATTAGNNAALLGDNAVQSIDPNLKVPTVVRANIGFSTRFGGEGNGLFDNWGLNLDYIYSRDQNPYNFIDLTYAIDPNKGNNGFTVDGRPLYSSIDPLIPGCTATYSGTGTDAMFQNVNDVCFATGREDEIQLTNADGYDNHTASIVLTKNVNTGLFTSGGRSFFSLGYAYVDSNNRRDSSSSTATSNYTRTAAFDRQNPAVSASNFEVRHNITFGANFEEALVGDGYMTGLGLFFNAQSGTPYSLTFDGNGGFDEISSSRDAALLYVPTGINDPNLSPNSDPDAVNTLLAALGDYNCDFTTGETVSRNSCRNDWYFDLDLRLSQELPGPGSFFGLDDKIEIFSVFDNFLNFIDGEWNARRFQTSDGFLDLVDGSFDDQGRYVITGFNVGSDNDIDVLPSRWAIKLGVRYEF